MPRPPERATPNPADDRLDAQARRFFAQARATTAADEEAVRDWVRRWRAAPEPGTRGVGLLDLIFGDGASGDGGDGGGD